MVDFPQIAAIELSRCILQLRGHSLGSSLENLMMSYWCWWERHARVIQLLRSMSRKVSLLYTSSCHLTVVSHCIPIARAKLGHRWATAQVDS
jgi:hypothetical protein